MTDDTAMTPPPKPGRGKLRRNPTTLDLTASPAPAPDRDQAVKPTDEVGGASDASQPSMQDAPIEAAARPSAVEAEPARPAGESSGTEGFMERPNEGAGSEKDSIDETSAADMQDDGANRLRAAASGIPPSGIASNPAGPGSSSSPPQPPPESSVSVKALALAAIAGAIAGGLVSFLLMPTSTPVDETASRLMALERRVAALPAALPQDDVKALATRVQGLSEEVAGLGRDVAAAAATADQAASRAAALEKAPQPAPAQPSVPPQVVQAQEQRLNALEGAIDRLDPARLAAATSDASTRAGRVATLAARAVLAEDLLGRIRRGEPLSQTVDRLAALGVPEQKLAPLRQASGAAVASLSTLRAEFEDLEDRLAQSQEAQPEDFTSRALASINRLVRIRTVGGDAVTDGVAAVNTALARGDGAAALTAWQALPESARKTSAPWGAALERHVAAEGAAQTLSDETVTALAGEATGAGTGARP
ncbi:hypothetical protein [Chelatococcus sp. YT9]|uniref:COG4223 family protein n=1 Tax=Chelatococcus sp. YT9 TaxID=2835635 RepID=UPI001BCC4433|nr:hypothetical protein [Chelatococcus sp. YT9]MBS7697148.1 hypothetical protein [Chelatococcus sp. YT9]